MILNDIPHPARKRIILLDDECRNLLTAFRKGAEDEILLEHVEKIEQIWEDLNGDLPSSDSKSFFSRHMFFVRHYIEEENRPKCEDDVRYLTSKDIPGIIKSLDAATSTPSYHPRIAERVFPPIKRQEFDSAIRRAFAVLKTALVEK